MENTPEAPAAPAESVATPNTNSNAPAQPDMHGFTSDDLAGMRTFIDNNGGWEKIKSRISNPEPAPAPAAAPKVEEPAPKVEEQSQQPRYEEPVYRAPAGSITAEEFLAKQYFDSLAHEEKYAAISKEIADGDVLKEMASFNIQPLNRDGSINDTMVRRYLDLKAQTVPAKQSGATPEASAAPTVDYVPVGEKINDIDQAYAVIRQDAQLKASGMAGHPNVALAEEFIKNSYKDRK